MIEQEYEYINGEIKELKINYRKVVDDFIAQIDSDDNIEELDDNIKEYLKISSLNKKLNYYIGILLVLMFISNTMFLLFHGYFLLSIASIFLWTTIPLSLNVFKTALGSSIDKFKTEEKMVKLEKRIKSTHEYVAEQANLSHIKAKTLLIPYKKTLYFSKTKAFTKNLKELIVDLPKKSKKWDINSIIAIRNYTTELNSLIKDMENNPIVLSSYHD